MSKYIQFKLSDDSEATILVEVSETSITESGWSDAGMKETAVKVGEQAKVSLAAAMDNVKASAETVLGKLRDIKVSERPTEIELEFGLKLDAVAGAVIAQAGTEVNYTVRLTWCHTPAHRGVAQSRRYSPRHRRALNAALIQNRMKRRSFW